MSGWRSTSGKLTIKRMSEPEIDKAITELEKRGYELVKKDLVSRDYDEYNDHFKRAGTAVFTQWQAELRRG